MKQIKQLSIILILSTVIFSCIKRKPTELIYKKKNDFNFMFSNKLTKGEAPLNYNSLRKYILKPKCFSCHAGKKAEPDNDPIDFSTYSKMMKKRDISLFSFTKQDSKRSRFYRSLVHVDIKKRMPKKGKALSQSELNFIQDWIASCAPEKTLGQIPSHCKMNSNTNDNNDDWGDDDWVNDSNNQTKKDYGNDWKNGNDWVGWKRLSIQIEDYGNDWLSGNDWVNWK